MEHIETMCQGCGNTFMRERKRGRPATKCLSCKEGKQTVMQFTTVDGVVYKDSKNPCVGCGETFQHPRKKGRPPTRCVGCQKGVDAAKAAEMTVSDEKLEELFRGPKALLNGTPKERPRGREAQCPRTGKCGRIFTSNTSCDLHKRWLPNGSYECIDPATLGMEPRARVRDKEKPEERTVPVWTRPTPEEE